MKKDIILAGVGGQGILSIAAIIGLSASRTGLQVKQAEVHGMSQRGGAVQSHLRLSDGPVYSDLIGHGNCDIIISVEPMESLRYLPYLKKEGWLITNSVPFKNIPDYPNEEEVMVEITRIKNHIVLDADQIAKEAGSVRASNMVILGAASEYTEISSADFLRSIEVLFGRKGEKTVELNKEAFKMGHKEAAAYTGV